MNINKGFQAPTRTCLAYQNIIFPLSLVISKYMSVNRVVYTAAVTNWDWQEGFQLSSFPSAMVPQHSRPEPLLSLPGGPKASWAHHPPALGLLWVWVDWELSEMSSQDPRWRKSWVHCPSLTLCSLPWNDHPTFPPWTPTPRSCSRSHSWLHSLDPAQLSEPEITHFTVLVKSYITSCKYQGIPHVFLWLGWREGKAQWFTWWITFALL